MMGGLPCNALPANGTRGSMGECSQYWAGKGPQWERFGWQLAQSGAKPSAHAGQLIQYNVRPTPPPPHPSTPQQGLGH